MHHVYSYPQKPTVGTQTYKLQAPFFSPNILPQHIRRVIIKLSIWGQPQHPSSAICKSLITDAGYWLPLLPFCLNALTMIYVLRVGNITIDNITIYDLWHFYNDDDGWIISIVPFWRENHLKGKKISMEGTFRFSTVYSYWVGTCIGIPLISPL